MAGREKSPSPARLQNRTCEFPLIRLLGDRVCGHGYRDGISRRLLVVAMAMEQLPVGVAVAAPETPRDDVIDLWQVTIAEEQGAPCAPSSLPLQESSDPSRQIGMAPQPCAPVNPVAVEGAACPLHLDVLAVVRRPVFDQGRPFGWS